MTIHTHTWLCFLLWVGFATQDKTPDVMVKCAVSEQCLLPCSFTPGNREVIHWFRQEVLILKYRREKEEEDGKKSSGDNTSSEEEEEEDNEDDDDDESLGRRVAIFPQMVSHGNATLVLKKAGINDRGPYRCQVTTSQGQSSANVIVKLEAPIRGLSLELSRLSGYEEMKCSVRQVFPPPRVAWATEPPILEDLRPITRKLADKQGLYTVDSRLKLLTSRPDLIYLCKVTPQYGGPTWTASLREKKIRGMEGKDLTIPCLAPPQLNRPLLSWSFSSADAPTPHDPILTYNSFSGESNSSEPWDNHVELDGFRVPFGDGSLRLMDPRHSKHEGTYTCVFTVQPYVTYTEHTDVSIDDPNVSRSASEGPSYWWIAGVVITALVLALAGIFIYLKRKGRTHKQPRDDTEESTELHTVKDSTADSHMTESRPINTAGQSNPQTNLEMT